MATYSIGQSRLTDEDDGFEAALAEAHAARQRPRCLCRDDGVEMYVARYGDSFVVKRMPYTGSEHALDCSSYETPAGLCGVGPLNGTAIRENMLTGQTELRLGFALSKVNGSRSTQGHHAPDHTSATTEGPKLSLLGLLHYLWDQAGLTRWQPEFQGKRTWATVRTQLLKAAQNCITRGVPLNDRLYVPEPFSVDAREQLDARRIVHWAKLRSASGSANSLILLIAELKELGAAHFGHRAVIKHMPDQAFAVDDQLYARIGRCFESQLALWNASDAVRMVTTATFGISDIGVPTIQQISLMPVNAQWLPVDDAFEHQLLYRLVREQRVFAKCLRYNLPASAPVPTAVLLDVGVEPLGLWIAGEMGEPYSEAVAPRAPCWQWTPMRTALPPLPARSQAAVIASSTQSAASASR